MERTDSRIIQVSPSYENAKIQVMQHWGWNLHGRQEIHEQGDAEIQSSNDGSRVVKQKVDKYVKLHFTRPLSLPNLDRLKQLEAEYDSLVFPSQPTLGFPIGLTAFFGFGFLVTPGFNRLVVLIPLALCGYWISRCLAKRKEVGLARHKSTTRAQQLMQEAMSLV